MNVCYGIDKFKRLSNAVVTSGTFDGVHLGHHKIIDRLKELATQSNSDTVVITFWPHPRIVLTPEKSKDLFLLSTIEERIELLRESGIDHLLIIPFTKEFSALSSTDFIQKILIDCIGTTQLVIGYDHKFGRNREGSFDYLKENTALYPFTVEEIPREDIEDLGISSSLIRDALQKGAVDKAALYLGRYYDFSGKIIIGQQLGRKIGFPTANIEISDTRKLIPADGVYAAKAFIDDTSYNGMLNIGIRPTIEGAGRSIEIHLFDFESDIYGKNIRIELINPIRKEQRFDSIDDLKIQLESDKQKALEILKNY